MEDGRWFTNLGSGMEPPVSNNGELPESEEPINWVEGVTVTGKIASFVGSVWTPGAHDPHGRWVVYRDFDNGSFEISPEGFLQPTTYNDDQLKEEAALFAKNAIVSTLDLSQASNYFYYIQVQTVLQKLYINVRLNPHGVIDGPGANNPDAEKINAQLSTLKVNLTNSPVLGDAHYDAGRNTINIDVDGANTIGHMRNLGSEVGSNFTIMHELGHAFLADTQYDRRQDYANTMGVGIADYTGLNYPTFEQLSGIGGSVDQWPHY